MSSRYGPRPPGSDGTDFSHREQIAGHYQTSVLNKTRLRYVIYLHFLLCALMFVRLLPSILLLVNQSPPQVLLDLDFPAPMLWEFAWITSFIPAIFGLLSLSRNRVFMINQYQLGSVVFGVLPTLYGIASMLGELLEYWRTRETSRNFMEFPVVLLWNMFLIIALQVHFIGVLLARSLAAAWQPKKRV